MLSLSKYIKIKEEKEMLTPYIEKNKITLIHGESGSGKTVFILEHLNSNAITPILLDFDDNEPEEIKEMSLECTLVDGELFMEDYPDNLSLLENQVVIIDTWTLFHKYIGDENTAYNMLKKWTEKYNITIIILAHTQPFSGKEDKPEVADHIYRHIKARLYIRRTTLKSSIEYHLLIEKLRGYKGNKIIELRKETI